jgi:hypothetical protein
MNQPTPALAQRRRNAALLIGVAFIFLTILSNVPSLYAWNVPGWQLVLPYISLLLPAIALICFTVGLKRAFGQPAIYGGKIWGSIVGVVSLLLVVGSVWLYQHGKDLPASGGAPKIGQKAPDFTLNDISGNPVSLSTLLTTPIDASSGKAPKAVLLVFYRGYW